MCECYQIGGRFIAEDPDCPVHGTQSKQDRQERRAIALQLEIAIAMGTDYEIRVAAGAALDYLQSMD